ncbi:glycosyltransferase family 4 protein [Streptococcus zalophi]|uniref:Glycosyltransferase family 4 protein n=1 Tax=Streptococcus zalophi TaxID=640031 RepID=A0A934UCY1_9STRE|nr:glycosyltransferase family 4 protein [Streptococcus zalophi]MBJ8349200.1 glycosyltransferase family 4 protein [Streptococcus zalophi]
MRIGLFTDTYFPQVSGVATSIYTLKTELEKLGHDVYIFTTTDKHVKRFEDPTIIRLPSIPFVSFTDRRIVYRGLFSAYKIAKNYDIEIIHTQTEFGMGLLGKMVGKALRIPVVHTYHTQYEDYVGYIAKGKVIRPSMVKYIVRGYLNDLDGVICPTRIVYNILEGYDIKILKQIIPTGIKLDQFVNREVSQDSISSLREELGILPDETMLLSLSRISYEKNIQAIILQFPLVLAENNKVKLVIVGDGPYIDNLKDLVNQLGIYDHVIFTGMIDHDDTVLYYKSCDFFISASTSETQGLTYIESLASGKPVIAHGNPYLDDLINDKMFGTLYYRETDLSDAILDAIINTPQMNPNRLRDKLCEISAEEFGKAAYAFYLDVIIAKKMAKKEKLSLSVEGSKTDPSIKLVKNTMTLPVKAIKLTAKTSVKVVKTPKKIVNRIRDFLD